MTTLPTKLEQQPTVAETSSLSSLKILKETSQYTLSEDPQTGKVYATIEKGKFWTLKDQRHCQVCSPNLNHIGLEISTDFIVTLASEVIEALYPKSPKLAEFVLSHSSTMILATSVKSPSTLETYCYWLQRFCRYLKSNPDKLIEDATDVNGAKTKLHWFIYQLRKTNDLADGTLLNVYKAVKTFYQSNSIAGVELLLMDRKSIRRSPKFDDRPPNQEELVKIMNIAEPRQKVAIAMMSLGGFRPSTLVKLKYRHIKEDFEKGRTPIHIHVEAKIVKGQYAPYDTFLGAEAVEALRQYLEIRRLGTRKTPPEEITDESPLLRNEQLAAHYLKKGQVAPNITQDRLGDAIHGLYYKVGLITREKGKRRYETRPYSLRKFFKTQLEAKGIKTIYVEYMMGHTRSPYDKTSESGELGIEFLRDQYACANLQIRPKPSVDDQFYTFVEDMITSKGYNVNVELLRRAVTKPHRTILTNEDVEKERRDIVKDAFLNLLRGELGTTVKPNGI